MFYYNLLIATLLTYGTLAAPTTRTAEAVVVNESDRIKSCPSGYQMLGKQCARTITEEPDIVCAPGYEFRTFTEDCVRYVAMESECSPGYDRELGICTSTRTAPTHPVCPDGFLLQSDNAHCVDLVQLPDHDVCPAGSEPRGEICLVFGTEAPIYVCPTGYALVGDKCEVEEFYDCTPPEDLNFLRGVAGDFFSDGKEHDQFEPATFSTVRSDPFAPAFSFMAPAGPATSRSAGFYEDFVVQSSCKRIRVEPATKICENGVLEGKTCTLEIQVRSLTVPGGVVENVIPPTDECQTGFSRQGNSNICRVTDEIPPTFYCPVGSADLGDRCAFYSPTRQTCNTGFSLVGSVCEQTLFAPPLIEYTVTYSCVGKECL